MNFRELSQATASVKKRRLIMESILKALLEGAHEDKVRRALANDPTLSPVIDEIMKADPTENKAYVDWIVKMLRQAPSAEAKQDALKKIAQMLPIYNRQKQNLQARQKDINYFRSVDQMVGELEHLRPEAKDKKAYEEPFQNNVIRRFREGKDSEYIMIFENAEWLVFKPLQFKVSNAFENAFPRWCTSYGAGSFVAHNGDDGGLIYVCAKKFEDRPKSVALEIKPNADPGIIEVIWWDINNKIMFEGDYRSAVSKLDVPDFVKQPLLAFRNKAPMPIPEDMQAQIDHWVGYLGNPPEDDKLSNFLIFARSVVSDRRFGWGQLMLFIDMSSYINDIAMEFKAKEREILSGMDAGDMSTYNDNFEEGVHAQDVHGMGARIEFNMQPTPENIDEYLRNKYDVMLRRYSMQNYPNGSGVMGLLAFYTKGMLNLTNDPDMILSLFYPYMPWRIIINQLYRENEKGVGYGPQLWRILTGMLDSYVPGDE